MPNVLMAKEAVDSEVDFVAAYDENGNLAEGATENIGIVTSGGELLFPKAGHILRGTTMIRVAELAGKLIQKGLLKKVEFRNISRRQVKSAKEILIVGTTPNVAFVKEYDGKKVGGGKAGPVFTALHKFLLDDIYHNKKLRTPVF